MTDTNTKTLTEATLKAYAEMLAADRKTPVQMAYELAEQGYALTDKAAETLSTLAGFREAKPRKDGKPAVARAVLPAERAKRIFGNVKHLKTLTVEAAKMWKASASRRGDAMAAAQSVYAKIFVAEKGGGDIAVAKAKLAADYPIATPMELKRDVFDAHVKALEDLLADCGYTKSVGGAFTKFRDATKAARSPKPAAVPAAA